MTYIKPSLISKGNGGSEGKDMTIVIMDTADILTTPARDGNGVLMAAGNFVFAAGKYATKMQVTSSKTSLPRNSDGEEDNVSISALPEFSIPGSALEFEEFVQNWTNKSIIVAVRIGACGGSTPFWRVFGSKCAPLSLLMEGQNNNDGTSDVIKFQQFTKTKDMPARYTGTFTYATATTVAADATTVDVTNGAGEYQLTDNTVATIIADITNAVAGGVYTLIGSGGTNPATIEATNAKFLLAGAVDWQGLSGATLTVEAFEVALGAFVFVEKSRA